MTDAALFTDWIIGLIITAVVVVIVAALLLWILFLVRRIATNATRALHAVEQIRVNTLPIWQLQDTNEVGVQLMETAQSIRQHAEMVADTLEGQHLPVPSR